MKLNDSMIEHGYREQLISSRQSLFNDSSKKQLYTCLKEFCPEMKTAYVLGWAPEQGEDIYRALINTDMVCAIELEHGQDEPAVIETIQLKEYEKELSKTGRIKLAVALDLAAKDIAAALEIGRRG